MNASYSLFVFFDSITFDSGETPLGRFSNSGENIFRNWIELNWMSLFRTDMHMIVEQKWKKKNEKKKDNKKR